IQRPRGPPVNQLYDLWLSPLPRPQRSVTSCGSRNTPPAPQRSHPMRFVPSLAVVALVACAAPLAAQETPTEKSAAADVVRRMNALERSLALPALVARLTGARDPRRAAALAVAEFLTASKTPGTVTVYGTPAEEIGSPEAKTTMYQAGVFKGADVLVRSHSSTATQAPGPGFGSCCMNIDVVRYIFSGA